eukprot:CAMPEP_0195011358 /NCGR_PEP_ID=MMETSP0326_2-20130528/10891_1 /TAXON_ID=2866 ORGANISM="Crypthecodinium cohnii, Strain Seligo" /NCGR_SAMPLE_ID=MMETSP0326_2 /ASSEMBLY_ACC=CAM_ASM_000348 /LENGTH=76 /DNA_ID=CAMNT_0040020447 /DNA_START=491 /DNA_END=718 /DNA_ORIENTATION=-
MKQGAGGEPSSSSSSLCEMGWTLGVLCLHLELPQVFIDDAVAACDLRCRSCPNSLLLLLPQSVEKLFEGSVLANLA